MCFGVRFSLYLASCFPDFDLFFSVCVVWGGGEQYGDQKKGETNLKKGGTGPPVPPPPGSAYDYQIHRAGKLLFHCRGFQRTYWNTA